MMDVNKYLIDGSVKRDRIVADIKRGRIEKSEILELDKNEQIKAAYFGPTSFEKRKQVDWNSNYLDELALGAVSEVFNKDYLLYLSEVATYVAEKQEKKQQKSTLVKGIIVFAIVVVVVICIIAFISSRSKKDESEHSIGSSATAEETYLSLAIVLR